MQIRVRRRVAASVLLAAAVVATVGPQSAGLADGPAGEVIRYTIDGGGGMQAMGGMYVLSSTIGQPDAGVSTGGDYLMNAAFWFPVLAGDSGEDGTVDPADYAAFSVCSTGPGGPPPTEECQCFDVDHSGAIDLADFAVIQTSYTGS